MVVDEINSLPTPCLLLDVQRLDANIATMKQRVETQGAALRPHVKTSKSVRVIERLFRAGASLGPITVSTLREAEYFAEAGATDILYAVSIVHDKLARVAAIQQGGATVHVILDNGTVVDQIAQTAKQLGEQFSVLIELDCDGHRAGLSPEKSAEIVALAQSIVSMPSLRFSGVLTHAGESYGCPDIEAIGRAADVERESTLRIADALQRSNVDCPIRSIGSSPTALMGRSLDGITEVRAGVFMFQDLFQSNLGVCGIDDIALSVLATVISHQPDRGWLIVDAGGLALSKDRGTASQRRDYGYGLVCDVSGVPLEHYVVEQANQEHGIIRNHAGEVDFERFPIGSRLRILPNHACMTAAAHPHYHAIHDSRLEVWPRINGW